MDEFLIIFDLTFICFFLVVVIVRLIDEVKRGHKAEKEKLGKRDKIIQRKQPA